MAQFEPLAAEIQKLGASVVFIAAEKRGGFFKPADHLRKHPVSFPFLLDEDRAVTKTYGVYHRLGLDAYNIAHPATFVIGRDGVVRWIFVGESQGERAPLEKVLNAAKTAKDGAFGLHWPPHA
jgi:peroxiredoxin